MRTRQENDSGPVGSTGANETETQEFISKKQIVEMWIQEIGIVPANVIELFEKSDQTVGAESNHITNPLSMFELILLAFLLSASEDRDIYFEYWNSIFMISSIINYDGNTYSTSGTFTLLGNKDTGIKPDYLYTTMKNSVASLLNLDIN